jgi:formylglycine-generating enzyme required for sulfatase activity
MAAPSLAGVVTFGSGANEFQMEFVTIGNPGNDPDTDPAARPVSSTLGAVGYTYGIGKFEVSEDMIEKFNASQSLQITKDTRGTNKPATSVSWNEAARFVNWLNTSTGYAAAYKFDPSATGVNDHISLWQSGDAGYDASNPYRNSLAKYFLPSFNEWYKAAYYNPNDSTYYDYATGSNTAPTAVASGTGTEGNGNNEAVYDGQSGPADVNQAGGLSPYGVMGLGGNVFEFEESSGDLLNSSGDNSFRGLRGGFWESDSSLLPSSARDITFPSVKSYDIGFRVASLSSSAPPPVPEPSMMVIGSLFGLGGLIAKRRLKK